MKYILPVIPKGGEVWDINCAVSLIIREVQTQTAILIPARKAIIKKKPKLTSVAKDAGKRELWHAAAGSENYCILNESTKEVPKIIKSRTTTWSGHSATGYVSKGNGTYHKTGTCTPMFMAALFTKIQTRSICPSMDELRSTYAHIMENCSVT